MVVAAWPVWLQSTRIVRWSGVWQPVKTTTVTMRHTDTPAAGASGQAVAGVGDNEFALQLGQDREHAEHGPSFAVAVSIPCLPISSSDGCSKAIPPMQPSMSEQNQCLI